MVGDYLWAGLVSLIINLENNSYIDRFGHYQAMAYNRYVYHR